MTIGILALQGAFIEHMKMLAALGFDCREIRQRSDWTESLQALIIPGGESTVISKLLTELDLLKPISEALTAGLPVLGTCAGLIVLAKKIKDQPPSGLMSMDIEARRNAYGRQLGSFTTEADFAGQGPIPMVFIRAPYIESVQSNVKILAEVDGHIVAARQNNMLVTAFHPELTENTVVHQYFLSMLQGRA